MAVLVVAAVMVFALLTAGPASDDTVLVVPSADGHIGTVVVHRGQSREVLHEAYVASRDGQLTRLTPAEVEHAYGATLQALPARPATFLLYFVTGTDELTEESKRELDKVLAELRSRPVPDVLVIGHTDTVGDAAWNDRLSAQRAERVKAYLVEIGIPAGRIRTAGRGERELLVPTTDNTEEPRNRRVEINVR
jgi:outer membrane protein OmpA-like peptidoglycan-associated protein